MTPTCISTRISDSEFPHRGPFQRTRFKNIASVAKTILKLEFQLLRNFQTLRLCMITTVEGDFPKPELSLSWVSQRSWTGSNRLCWWRSLVHYLESRCLNLGYWRRGNYLYIILNFYGRRHLFLIIVISSSLHLRSRSWICTSSRSPAGPSMNFPSNPSTGPSACFTKGTLGSCPTCSSTSLYNVFHALRLTLSPLPLPQEINTFCLGC